MRVKNGNSFAPLLSRLAIAMGVVFAVTACQPEPDEKTLGQKLDQGIANTEQTAQRGMDKAEEKMESAASSVALATTDAAITTSINAALVNDPQLSALRIDVDTQEGRVNLSGKAPDESSKTRATTLAKAVEGVKSVENRLVVGN